MNKLIKFEISLGDDAPDKHDFINGRHLSSKRYLVIDLIHTGLRFTIEDRGSFVISSETDSHARIQEYTIQRYQKTLSVTGKSYDLHTKLQLIETAGRKLSEDVMWNIFWDLEVKPSFSMEDHWLKSYAPNFTLDMHDSIMHERLNEIRQIMEE